MSDELSLRVLVESVLPLDIATFEEAEIDDTYLGPIRGTDGAAHCGPGRHGF